MLKLLRNHLLDEGYQLSNDHFFEKEVFEELLNSQQWSLKFTHKITPNHLLVTGTERQNIHKGAELLSGGTVAGDIVYLLPGQGHVEEFVQTDNAGFDMLN